MVCQSVRSGEEFLASTLANIDCHGRTIGSYGYGALADPSSSLSQALTVILTIFLTLYGIRMLMGYRPDAADLIGNAIRVGLFLALATSWPAWRVVGYDLVLNGPHEVAQSIGLASGMPGNGGDLAARLQDADDGVVTVTMYGSGRLTGGIAAGADIGDQTRGVALADQFALGLGRTAFLSTAIGAQGLLSLGAGILLAVAPLMAGLLLFAGTMGLFLGWIRGLVFCALGSIAFQLIMSSQLALLYPWLEDVLSQRQSNTLMPSAPTELFVITIAFSTITCGALYVIGKMSFFPLLQMSGRGSLQSLVSQTASSSAAKSQRAIPVSGTGLIAGSGTPYSPEVNPSSPRGRIPDVRLSNDSEPSANLNARSYPGDHNVRLGSSYRRNLRRVSPSHQRRDR